MMDLIFWVAVLLLSGTLCYIFGMVTGIKAAQPTAEPPYNPPPISEQEEKAIWRAYWLVNQDKFLSEYTEE